MPALCVLIVISMLAGDCRGRSGGLRRRDAECRPSGWRRWLASRVWADGIGMLMDQQFDASGNTPPLAWPGQAGRQFGRKFASSCHELSVIAVCRLGWEGRIAIDTM